MFDDDLEPRKNKKEVTIPRNLDNLSVDELEEYIDELRVEISRAEVDIKKKKTSKSAADSIFKN